MVKFRRSPLFIHLVFQLPLRTICHVAVGHLAHLRLERMDVACRITRPHLRRLISIVRQHRASVSRCELLLVLDFCYSIYFPFVPPHYLPLKYNCRHIEASSPPMPFKELQDSSHIDATFPHGNSFVYCQRSSWRS